MLRKIIAGLIFLILPVVLFAGEVSPDLARLAATNFLSDKITGPPVLRKALPSPVVTPRWLDGTLAYYFIEFPGEGYVAVAGDDRCTPILAWSPEPLVNPGEMPAACAAWFDWYARQVVGVKEKNLPSSPEIQQLWSLYGTTSFHPEGKAKDAGVGPLTVSSWGQRYYYNNMCPADPDGPGGHALAGCVATAMAQLLFYYRYPEHGEGANGYMSDYGYEYVDLEEAEYRWDEMVNAVFGEINWEVAELVYHVGVSVEMNYGPNSSGSTTEEAADALKTYFRYSDALQYISKFDLGEAFRDSVISSLDRNLVLLYRGGSFGTSHAFVCDGYQDSTYLHFNWGWDGNFNGYFTIESLTPGPYDFTFDQGAVINIYPREEYPGYCQGTSSLTTYRGTFEDGSGPEVTPANTNCSFQVSPDDPDIGHVMLWFTRFDTQVNDGVVTVYDGPGAGAPVLGQYSGSDLPPLLVSSGSEVLVHYETGSGDPSQGWQVEYFAYSGPFCNEQAMYTAFLQPYFSDGSGPYNYTDLSDCGWLISPQDEAHDSIGSINLDFHWLDMEPGDTLFVYDGEDNTAPLIGKFSGTAVPGSLESAGNKVYLNFVSDGQGTGDGWAAGYSSNLPVYCSDTAVYTDKTAILEDGSGDKKYVPNSNCYWLVTTENTEVITFEFLEFDLEYGYDQLRFYDASVSPVALVATYFGHDLPGLLVVPSDKVLMRFVSDASEEHGGWKVKYTALAPGVAEKNIPMTCRLIPNPARGKVQLQVAGGGARQHVGYRVFDAAMGMKVQGTLEIRDNAAELDVSNLHAGIYFLLLTDEEESVMQKLIIR